ncbi:hypothetical protein SAMN02910456_02224 [Ruminococcaceae bacterium YRB3002]|nr:hypothetical protein SAMN02910456_02224 [Ruminococcaceae bacterium YRB3002]
MPLIQAKCTNCGANLEFDDSREKYFCMYCGTPFINQKTINNYQNTTNITNIYSSTESIGTGSREPKYLRLIESESRIEGRGDPGLNIYSNALKRYLTTLLGNDDSLIIYGGDNVSGMYEDNRPRLPYLWITEEYEFIQRPECMLVDRNGNTGTHYFNSNFYPLRIKFEISLPTYNEDILPNIKAILQSHFSSKKTLMVSLPGLPNMFVPLGIKLTNINDHYAKFEETEAVYPVLNKESIDVDSDQRAILCLLKQALYLYEYEKKLKSSEISRRVYAYLLTGQNEQSLSENKKDELRKIREVLTTYGKINLRLTKKAFGDVINYYPQIMNHINDHDSFKLVRSELDQLCESAKKARESIIMRLGIPESWNYEFISKFYKNIVWEKNGEDVLNYPQSIASIKLFIMHEDCTCFDKRVAMIENVRRRVINDDIDRYNQEHVLYCDGYCPNLDRNGYCYIGKSPEQCGNSRYSSRTDSSKWIFNMKI